jgi:hypothetical protein
MGPAGLLLTMRAAALRLPALGVHSPAHWLLTGPGRGLEASALSAQCGCWSRTARRGVDGASEFDLQGHTGESRIDRRRSTRQMLRDEFWLKDNGAASLLGCGTVWTYLSVNGWTHACAHSRPTGGRQSSGVVALAAAGPPQAAADHVADGQRGT